MGTAILFRSAADLHDALDIANDRAPLQIAHVRLFRAEQRDRTEAWQQARVAEAIRTRTERERAADLALEAALARYTTTNAIA